MERIKPLRRYTLVDEYNNPLYLFLGQEENHNANSKDQGFRWMFKGYKIPMPVRSETWFNGFPADTMLDWLKGNGWTLHSMWNCATNRLTVYKYVDVPKDSKRNPVSTGNDAIDDTNRQVFQRIIKELCEASRKSEAVRLYRYVHGGPLGDANSAVNAIRDSIH